MEIDDAKGAKPLRLAICVKHVPTCDDIEVDEATGRIRRADAECDINPCDLNAMEMANALKKSVADAGGATIMAFSMGPDGARASLKKCLALGADEAYLLSDRKFAGCDTLGTARVLAHFLKAKGPFDVIFMGEMASDGATGQVGPMTAALLGVPDVISVATISCGERAGHFIVEQHIAEGVRRLLVKSPMVVTVPFGVNQPKLPTLRMQMRANKIAIPVLTAGELSADELARLAPKSIVTPARAIGTHAQAELIEGDAKAIAAKIRELVEGGRQHV